MLHRTKDGDSFILTVVETKAVSTHESKRLSETTKEMMGFIPFRSVSEQASSILGIER
jgi:hypothetical protein